MSFKSLINKEAPSVTLPDHDDKPYAIEPGNTGKPLVLFFYPKSGSYGCTKEACQFRDAIADKDLFKAESATVIGISADPVAKQKQFVEKQKLTYPILSDHEGKARKAYNVGRGMLGLTEARTTFIIDEKGIIRDALDTTINYGAHAKFVTRWLEKLVKEKEEQTKDTAPVLAEIPQGDLAQSAPSDVPPAGVSVAA